METVDLLVIGGGAGGFFGAITAAEAYAGMRVLLLEKGTQALSKVRISGGGRCNVTHSCFEPRVLSGRYPRGAKALLSAFSRFQPKDTVEWFEKRGVKLKVEEDGRMFPVTDRSETIMQCLLGAAEKAGVVVRLRCGVKAIEKKGEAHWIAQLDDGQAVEARFVLVATGGCRAGDGVRFLESLGHKVEKPVPSLFTFHVENAWVKSLAGVSISAVQVSVIGTSIKEVGPVLFTHWGLSGPGILRTSAWGARVLEDRDYRFELQLRWVERLGREQWIEILQKKREESPGKQVENTALEGIPSRLWEELVRLAGVPEERRWNQLTKTEAHQLAEILGGTKVQVSGKSLNKDEFVTCGGVSLKEVDFKTMESRCARGVWFAGEVLDIDGITGGFNFQSAWTTGWIAGQTIARICREERKETER